MADEGKTPLPLLLKPSAAARELGVVDQTLANWRSQGKGPPFVKIGGTAVRYPVEALKAYIEDHLVDVRGGGK
jgi:predicted DNA-binding transcriptional regulator AlpA